MIDIKITKGKKILTHPSGVVVEESIQNHQSKLAATKKRVAELQIEQAAIEKDISDMEASKE